MKVYLVLKYANSICEVDGVYGTYEGAFVRKLRLDHDIGELSKYVTYHVITKTLKGVETIGIKFGGKPAKLLVIREGEE